MRRRQILWFFVIYVLSLGSFALLALIVQVVLRWTA